MKKKKTLTKNKQQTTVNNSWFGKNFPTFKSWAKHFRITKELITVLFVLAPIGAIASFFLWFYNNYHTTPWELYQIIKSGRSTLSGLDILPGYLDVTDLPGYFEERKTTIQIIEDAMAAKGFTMYNLVDLARCESTYNPNAYNKSSGATGLFQYKKSTWGTTPYCNEDIWDPKAQTLATIWMFEHNRFREWECFRAGKMKSSPQYYRDYHGCGKEAE